jgi:flagellar hook assembly protein FlgD
MSLQIHDLAGRLVKSFPFNHLTIQPFNQMTWDGRDDHGKSVPKGIYFCKLEAGETIAVEKLVKIQ